MKTFIQSVILVAALAGSTISMGFGIINDSPVNTSLKHKNLFVFKTERRLIGAQVEIYTADGSLLAAEKLQRKKVVIDFGDATLGAYTIRITKGNDKQELHYIRR